MTLWFTAEITGSLKRTMLTERPISEETAKKLIEAGIYKQYAWDERINSLIYILTNMAIDYGLPGFLHEKYIDPEEN